jgi:hypothetical protein
MKKNNTKSKHNDSVENPWGIGLNFRDEFFVNNHISDSSMRLIRFLCCGYFLTSPSLRATFPIWLLHTEEEGDTYLSVPVIEGTNTSPLCFRRGNIGERQRSDSDEERG